MLLLLLGTEQACRPRLLGCQTGGMPGTWPAACVLLLLLLRL